MSMMAPRAATTAALAATAAMDPNGTVLPCDGAMRPPCCGGDCLCAEDCAVWSRFVHGFAPLCRAMVQLLANGLNAGTVDA